MSTAPATTRGGRQARRGFTLIEMSMSLLVSSILIVAIGSSVVLASHAIPDRQESTHEGIAAASGLDRMVAELRYARTIVERSATAIQFTVADRSGDLLDETIRYEWDGDSGDPLTRSYNGGAPVVVVESVKDLTLTYQVDSYQQTSSPSLTSEMLISSVLPMSATTFSITSGNWCGQLITPANPPAGAMQWGVTRVQLMASNVGGTGGETWVQFRPPNIDGRPSPQVLEQVLLVESTLTASPSWTTHTFTGVGNIPMNQSLHLILKWQKDSVSAGVQTTSGSSGFQQSTTSGLLWQTQSNTGLVHRVYGAYLMPGTTTTNYFLRRVDIELTTGTDRTIVTHASASLFNQPAVSGP